MRRAALYVRVSTDLQEREQTIQSQLAAVTRHAEQHGLQHLPALTYTDDGYSGTWLDRPALDELRDHAREGRFDVVVVLSPDRLARRYAYQVLLLEELKRAGIEILLCERPINDSPDDQLLLQIQGLDSAKFSAVRGSDAQPFSSSRRRFDNSAPASIHR